MATRDWQPSQGVIEAERRAAEMLARRDEEIIAEHEASERRILDELLAPDITIVSVAEVEQLVKEMDDNPAAFCARFAVMRRQMKKMSDFQQGMVGIVGRLERAEETLSRFRANEVA